MTNDTTARVATRFAALLLDDIGEAKMLEVKARNATESSPDVCHSHDFCDANMVMADAFQAETGRPIDIDSDADLKTWNDAWAMFHATCAIST